MAVGVRASGQINHLLATNVATASWTVPATAVAGDLALFVIGSNTAVGTFTLPTSPGPTPWVQVGQPVVSNSAYTTQVFGKMLEAADIGAAVTTTISPAGRVHGVYYVFSGAAGIPTVFANTPDTTAGATITAPNITTAVANTFIINFGMIRSATTSGPITVTVDASGVESSESDTNFAAGTIPNFAAVAARRNVVPAAAGTVAGAATFTSTDAGSTGQGWTFGIEPSVAGTTTTVAHVATATPVVVGGTVTDAAIPIPTAAAVGNLAVLVFSGSEIFTNTAPAGWTKRTSQSKPGLSLDVWTKPLVLADLNTSVTVTSDNDIAYKRVLNMTIFSGAQLGSIISTTETATTTAHKTPAAAVTDAGAWSFVGVVDRASPGSQTWTVPAPLTSRAQSIGVGGGSVSTVTATATPTTSTTTYTITGSASTPTAAMFTAIIEPSSATVSGTVNAGADIYTEPRKTITRTATATGSPTSWAWTQVSPATPVLALSGASTPTVSFTVPAGIALRVFTLRVTVGYASGPSAVGDFTVSVYPVTRRFVRADGVEVPLRTTLVT